MEEKDEEGEISTSVHTYVLCTHVHMVRPITRLRVGSWSVGSAVLARVVFGDTSHEILVWVRADGRTLLGKENNWALINNLRESLKNFNMR